MRYKQAVSALNKFFQVEPMLFSYQAIIGNPDSVWKDMCQCQHSLCRK
uniref:Uncharacterized protein n=1 Tax=Arundo donax TaxID=35708 RepID=A0A0A9H1H0_ARUDO